MFGLILSISSVVLLVRAWPIKPAVVSDTESQDEAISGSRNIVIMPEELADLAEDYFPDDDYFPDAWEVDSIEEEGLKKVPDIIGGVRIDEFGVPMVKASSSSDAKPEMKESINGLPDLVEVDEDGTMHEITSKTNNNEDKEEREYKKPDSDSDSDEDEYYEDQFDSSEEEEDWVRKVNHNSSDNKVVVPNNVAVVKDGDDEVMPNPEEQPEEETNKVEEEVEKDPEPMNIDDFPMKGLHTLEGMEHGQVVTDENGKPIGVIYVVKLDQDM